MKDEMEKQGASESTDPETMYVEDARIHLRSIMDMCNVRDLMYVYSTISNLRLLAVRAANLAESLEHHPGIETREYSAVVKSLKSIGMAEKIGGKKE